MGATYITYQLHGEPEKRLCLKTHRFIQRCQSQEGLYRPFNTAPLFISL